MTTDAENNRPDAVESAGGYRNWSPCPGLLSFYTVWVVSRRLEKAYLEPVPTSEFGTTTDICQTLGMYM